MKPKSQKKVSAGSKSSKTKAELETELAKLNKLSVAQEITIQKLLKKIDDLEQLSAKTVPIIGEMTDIDEVTIAQIQLKKLAAIAATRQFTSEEARLFETYSKVIQQEKRLDQGNRKPGRPLRDVTPQNLLNIANLALPEPDSE